MEKQIRQENDRKKSKDKNGRQQVPRFARNDNFRWKLSKNGNGRGKRRSGFPEGMTERKATAKPGW
ncbi:hypothetical protein [Granulicella sp. L46]|jgi:hypothetical protein|uniref:hypothetical protein n=1 Tax=Granulicella sp. L46 TaxID=1641865 RepID=UPI00131D09D1|nr:hypothetical protein [Granulicella sp. L46]